MKLIEKYLISGCIEILTGLHIGAGKGGIEIGGLDNPVVKNSHTGEPYIPGSSIKGKLRCLMEWATGRVDSEGKVWNGDENSDFIDPGDPVLRIFGTTNEKWKLGPTRLLVRDATLNENWKNEIIDRGLPFTEEKFENNIDRIRGTAGTSGGGVRRTERVTAGTIFNFEMVYRVFDTGDQGQTDRDYLRQLLAVMRLLENDALGGSGSRGYGRIQFKNLKQDGRDIQDEFEKIDPDVVLLKRKAA